MENQNFGEFLKNINYMYHANDQIYDALLADLQSTTAHINQYPNNQSASVPPHHSPSSPHPPQQEPVSYQSQLHSPSTPYHEKSYTSIGQVNYNSNSRNRSETPPPLPPPPSQEILDNPSYQERIPAARNQPKQMSALTNHHYADVKQPPAVAPKPKRNENRNTVDSLLDQLENSVPTSPGNYSNRPPSVENGTGNYEYTQSMQHTYQHVDRQRIPPPAQAQSTATRELDDLMATLSDFKMGSGQPNRPPQQIPVQPPRSPSPSSEPSYARPQKSRNASQSNTPHHGELESMLGDLQSDMTKQGVTTKTKGLCGACNKPVVGQVITALGKIWHIEHFVCAHCNVPLGTKNFYERDGGAYCEQDYHSLFAPRCNYCNGPIIDKCVTALGTTWHPDHFFCAQCGEQFGDEGFHERDGKAYCRCGGCGNPILDNYISALNRYWHPECFVCRDCRSPFGGRSFFDHEGQPYCETHYHAKRGSLCASCDKPITGRCITAMYKKFHPEHFVCAFCLKQLNKGTFKEQNDKPYCHPCFVKLFG
ncbi:hypothetical protein KUTeg_010485 [Tegillarca granosa]|uniref:LIM zinc-binding domain-containing protein n=1 Tax=Tegillarca granosa TaxID=220873 RepID=A0ABQ9F9V1_TEGGR|nr:hypothetical protein KUTeg_010485 [Tegillarca granosa]